MEGERKLIGWWLIVDGMMNIRLMFNYEKLEVWKNAIALADLIYSITRDFPPEGRFGLTNQMRRAAVSISANIAEGSSRISRVDFARFIEIATGSAFEVVSHVYIARNQGFLSESNFQAIYEASTELGKMSSGLRRSLLGSGDHQPSAINHAQ